MLFRSNLILSNGTYTSNDYPEFISGDNKLIVGNETTSILHTSGENKTINIAPNPAKDFINIFVNSLSNTTYSIKIYDINGKCIFTNNFIAEKGINKYKIKLNSFIPGIYTLELSQNENIYIEKLIIK